ncbi:MAG TPA: hypothetical protein VEZ14_14450 [Dehalococcoidia bacterium]|nr:hypothetical protein [Dehalococcoidia bacterium]
MLRWLREFLSGGVDYFRSRQWRYWGDDRHELERPAEERELPGSEIGADEEGAAVARERHTRESDAESPDPRPPS